MSDAPMTSAVETLGPTRVKLTVEVPFDELKPSMDEAYRKIGQQVRVKGFRPGKVPPRILDQYVGRGAVLEEAVNEALPRIFGEAVRENNLDILGHPEIEVTNFADGDQLAFTAEVDVRPEIELPDYEGLEVVIESAEASDERIDEQIENLRERFATLKTVERAAQTGDFVSIDLAANIDGNPIEDAAANNLSYEVGSDSLVQGLDDAIVGLSAGESKDFETQLRAGDRGGEAAQASVTVRTVKEKDVPALDDDFAQTASEFDTLDELKAARMTKEQYAEFEGKSVEDVDAEIEEGAGQAIKAQFVLDAIARKEELTVSEAELTDTILRRAQQAGMRPDAFAQEVVNSGQLGALMSEVLRGKGLALVLEHAKIRDTEGN